MLRAVGRTVFFPDFFARERPEVPFERVRRAGGLLVFAAEDFWLVLAVPEVADGVPGVPAAWRQIPSKEMQTNKAASRTTVLLRFIMYSETVP
jgi:hypothetical protein